MENVRPTPNRGARLEFVRTDKLDGENQSVRGARARGRCGALGETRKARRDTQAQKTTTETHVPCEAVRTVKRKNRCNGETEEVSVYICMDIVRFCN